MKDDEISLILGEDIYIHPKREKYIKHKWIRKGFIENNNYTEKYYYIKKMLKEFQDNPYDVMGSLDGKVVTIYWKNFPPSSGILEDYGDNGFYFSTKNMAKSNSQIHLDDSEIAYIEKHVSPRKLWRKLNYICWKYNKIPDRFHIKISYLSPTSYGILNENKFYEVLNPFGKIGECFPWCQCRQLDNK